MTRQLQIAVFFDFICPWCLIGKRQLQAAIIQLHQHDPNVDVNLVWRGVQLIPDIPVDGVAFKTFYLQRLGSITAVQMRQEQVRQSAHTVGLEINFDRIQRMPNTAKVHHLFERALSVGTPAQCDMLLEQLFAAYFHHGKNIGDRVDLLKIAAFCGFSGEALHYILSPLDDAFISANTNGNGVPYFIFDGRLAMAGAQPANALYHAMLEALATQGQSI